MNIILRWVLFTLAVMLTAYIIPGFSVDGFISALILSLLFGFINTFIKPFLSLITFPVNFLTLGIFGIVLNALLFMLAGYFAPGVSIDGFMPAHLASLLVGILGGLFAIMPATK